MRSTGFRRAGVERLKVGVILEKVPNLDHQKVVQEENKNVI